MTIPIPKEQSDRLKTLLKPIAEMFLSANITLIVRALEGGNSSGSLVISSDNPTKALEALRHHMEAEAKRFAAEGARSGEPGAEFPYQRDIHEL